MALPVYNSTYFVTILSLVTCILMQRGCLGMSILTVVLNDHVNSLCAILWVLVGALGI